MQKLYYLEIRLRWESDEGTFLSVRREIITVKLNLQDKTPKGEHTLIIKSKEWAKIATAYAVQMHSLIWALHVYNRV